MIYNSNYIRIIKFIQKAENGVFESRVRLQKMAYLFKQLARKERINYNTFQEDFILYTFGPFSLELAQDVTNLAKNNIINEDSKEGSNTWKYSINNDKFEEIKEQVSTKRIGFLFGMNEDDFNKQFDKLYHTDLRVLELVATIVYFANDVNPIYKSKEKSQEKMSEVKERLKDVFPIAFDLAKEYFIVTN